MKEILATGLAAACSSLVAYVVLRWRASLTRAAFRQRQRYLPTYLGRLRFGANPPYRIQLVATIIAGLGFAALAVVFWTCFFGGVLAFARGEVAVAAQPAKGPIVRPPPYVFGIFLVIWAYLWWRGIRLLLNPTEEARYHEWLHSVTLPLDAPYPKQGDPAAVPPSHRSLRLMRGVGILLIGCGLGVFFLGLYAFSFPLLR